MQRNTKLIQTDIDFIKRERDRNLFYVANASKIHRIILKDNKQIALQVSNEKNKQIMS